MATIKEMAAKHNLCNNDQTTMAYRLGAIEVLEEIENTIEKYSKVNPIFPLSIEEVQLKKVKIKIKELKGE